MSVNGRLHHLLGRGRSRRLCSRGLAHRPAEPLYPSVGPFRSHAGAPVAKCVGFHDRVGRATGGSRGEGGRTRRRPLALRLPFFGDGGSLRLRRIFRRSLPQFAVVVISGALTSESRGGRISVVPDPRGRL